MRKSNWKWLFSILILMICNATFASPLLLKSPDGNYEFSLQHCDDGTGKHCLVRKGELIWSEAGGNQAGLVAGWSAGSDLLIFVEQDRMSLKLLSIKGENVTATKLDVQPLCKVGAAEVPYDWNAVGQGSIPHDLVKELKPLGKNTFGGVYLRAHYGIRVAVPFKLKIAVTSIGSVEAKYLIGKPRRLKKWSDEVPAYSELAK
ncbi:MAG TPA: hypothetical protein VHY22_17345 [Chthoniobacteraceae bacterium]|jgi:hypothetical protein|nr:hypothetical protein [Chthoniobacteraceae bacterium]